MALSTRAKFAIAVTTGAGLLWWLQKDAKAATKKKKEKKVQVCPPYDLDPGAVAEQAELAIENGMLGSDRIAIHVAATLYPTDIDGKKIPWPTKAPWQLSPDAPEAILCLLGQIKIILQELPIPEDPGGPSIIDILTPLISDTPTPGKFFLIYKDGPNALGKSGVTGQALAKISASAANDGQLRLKYLKHMTKPGSWNWNLYSQAKNNSLWPTYTNVEGRNLGSAWLPRHKDAIAALSNGHLPERNIAVDGSKDGDGTSYGLLWLPPINEDALKNLGTITSEGLTWPDGSSVLDPPSELLDLVS